MRRLILKCWLSGSLVLDDGSAALRAGPGTVILADDDNAARMIRRGNAVEAPQPEALQPEALQPAPGKRRKAAPTP